MTQRANISIKYEFIYQTLARFAVKKIARTPAPPDLIYTILKKDMPIWWAFANAANAAGRQPTERDLSEFAAHFSSSRTQWRELDTVKSGTQTEFIESTDALLAREVAKRVQNCDLILDLGCGWGHRMVDLYRLGVDATYYGGDRSLHSATLVKAVTGLFPNMRANWFRFDYLSPDFSSVPTGFRRVALASWHAIEQITTVGRGAFDAALAHFKGAEIIGVHVEPVTFQIDPSYAAQRTISLERGYNLDLYETLLSHPGITVLEAIACLCEQGGVDPALVHWKARS